MKLTHAQTRKDPSGLIEITVVVHHTYTYLLQSEYAHHQFLEEVKHKNYGEAISILRKFNCKKEAVKTENPRKEVDIFHAPM